MSTWVITASLFFVVVAAAQVPRGPTRSGPVGLVFPIPGAPLSAEQVEERTRTLPDGSSTTEIVRSQICRDGAGRMRIESSLGGSSGESYPFVYLIDPVARSLVILLIQSKMANRVFVPKSVSDGFAVGFPAVGEALPAGEWLTKTEGLGKRVINGVEAEGTRTARTSEDQPSLIAVQERWFSEGLGLAPLVEASGPNWRHTARIWKIERREPDPALFAIPSDYTVTEERGSDRPDRH